MTRAESVADACAREPIHLSGAIQPHGVLLACSLPDWTIHHASTNVAELFDVPADALVGTRLGEHVGDEVLSPLRATIALLDREAPPQRAAVGNIGTHAQLCDVCVHLAGGLVQLEIEPRQGPGPGATPTLVAQRMIARVTAASDMDGFHQRTAEEIRELTGYDRVMVYRFRHDDAGEVIAEALAGDIEPYLGLRYPASDIPAQARALYVSNRIRVIPDARYAAVAIHPQQDAGGQPLDLSRHLLRSVAPVHLEYLANMGVAASMSISIVVGGRLWGLVACHHRVPRRVPAQVRAAVDIFSQFISMRVSAAERDAALVQEERAREVRDMLALRLASHPDLGETLAQELPLVQQALDCDGVALRRDGQWTRVGEVPSDAGLQHALAFARARATEPFAATARVADWAGAPADGLAGLLAIGFGRGDDWLLFFRREQAEEVTWAGNPHKAAVATDDGVRIAPRRSFAHWRETVHGVSRPWTQTDRRVADRLRWLLHERPWQPLPAQADNVSDMQQFRRRHAIGEQKARLGQLSALLDGMAHLADVDSARIGERIAQLEADLRELALGASDTGDRRG